MMQARESSETNATHVKSLRMQFSLKSLGILVSGPPLSHRGKGGDEVRARPPFSF